VTLTFQGVFDPQTIDRRRDRVGSVTVGLARRLPSAVEAVVESREGHPQPGSLAGDPQGAARVHDPGDDPAIVDPAHAGAGFRQERLKALALLIMSDTADRCCQPFPRPASGRRYRLSAACLRL
jgi:hypothetical protein